MPATAKKSKWGRRWWWIPQLLALPLTGLAWLGMATDVSLLAPLSLLLPYLVLYHVVWSMMATAHLHPSALLGALILATFWTPMGSWMQVRAPRAAPQSETSLRVASWNVHHWRNRTWTDDSATVREMAEFVDEELAVDVLALQDVRRGTEADRRIGRELTHRVEAYDLSLYSRYPIVQWDRVAVPATCCFTVCFKLDNLLKTWPMPILKKSSLWPLCHGPCPFNLAIHSRAFLF